jgi:hypothetical protein
MKEFLKRFFIPAAAIALASCNAVIVESYPHIPAGYNEGDFEQATRKGAITTIVVGSPFSAQSGDFADRVRALMKDRVGIAPVTFVPSPGDNTTAPFKVVVVFNARDNASNSTICETGDKATTTAGGTGQVSVTMVFCEGNSSKSGTRGRVSGAQGPNDSKFVSLVRQVTSLMIPPPGLQRQLERDNNL